LARKPSSQPWPPGCLCRSTDEWRQPLCIDFVSCFGGRLCPPVSFPTAALKIRNFLEQWTAYGSAAF
jgi:hypothetical protein